MSNERFIKINKQIVDDIKQELRKQGHYAFGQLEESFEDIEIDEGDEFILTAQSLGYLEELEKGVPASQISIDSSNFDNLVKWVSLKIGAHGKAAASIAYAIIRKWRREGKPLEASKRFSKSGEIKHAVEITFKNNEEKYIDAIDKSAVGELDELFASKIKGGEI
jgi:hypothetical protein